MTERKYKEGLFRCYVAGGDPWDSPEGQTHYLEYDRDKEAERNEALGKALRRVVEGNDPKSSQIMAAELREYVLYSRQVSPDDELGAEIMLAIADALEKEAVDAVQTTNS